MSSSRVRLKKLATLIVHGSRRIRSFATGRPRLDWAVKTSAPADPSGEVWGDLFFANDVANALRGLGQNAVVDRHGSRDRPVQRIRDDVVIHLVGLHRPELVPGAINILWVISHPELITDEVLSLPFDLRYAASETWARKRSTPEHPVQALLQATDPARFSPKRTGTEISSDVLFVGKTRAVFRPIVRDAIAVGAEPAIYGDGWQEFIDPRFVRAEFLDNDRVPDAYRGARVVLNDHWQAMAEEGFASNRLFDAVATGAIVISDSVDGVPPEFGSAVRRYGSVDELRELLSDDRGWPDADERLRAASLVAERHSFTRRAEVLVDAALGVRRGRGHRARLGEHGGSRR